MNSTVLNIQDMHCGACEARIRSALLNLTGIQATRFNTFKRKLQVDHVPEVSELELIECIENAGFNPSVVAQTHEDAGSTDLLKRVGVAGLAMAQIMMIHIAIYAGEFGDMAVSTNQLFAYVALLFCIPVVTYSAIPFYQGITNLPRRGITMDTQIALAITVAFSASLVATFSQSGHVYYDSVAMFVFLLLLARYFEAVLKARLATQKGLISALPDKVTVLSDDGASAILPCEQLQPGTRVLVREGETIPADGICESEEAWINEALLTGESQPKRHAAGSRLFAGTTSLSASLQVQVLSRPDASRIAELDELAEQSSLTKSRAMTIADRVARVFVPAILLIALSTALVWWQIDASRALEAALAVLVVSCPCALSLSIPSAYTAAMSRLRQSGVFVRTPEILKKTADVRRVLLDKTGTLTRPAARTIETMTLGDIGERRCRELAAALAEYAAHPLSQALRVTGQTLPATNVQAIPHAGVQGDVEGCSVRLGSSDFTGVQPAERAEKCVYLSVDGQPTAVFCVELVLRDDAQATVDTLRRDNYTLSILSGDNEQQCRQVAEEIGISHVSQASPEIKQQICCEDDHTLYLGDGINDLPALASTSISATVLETNDLVKSNSDVVLLTSRLAGLLDLLAVGKKCRSIIVQNLTWAGVYNVSLIPLAALGLCPPWLAALGMSSSSILVMLNASRLLRAQLPSTSLSGPST